jgi:selenocysteine-specific elongation factor
MDLRLIIGTAGHVDHGKTALIRALTGHETDRLPEERARGISIELGFAPFTLPSGQRAAIVDVPGHERFIHHMVAGAQGMDLVLLVVAADEGVMPQTREHLEILTLLGVAEGIVCLTKIDLVDDEWRELIETDLRQELRGTFLEGAPIVGISSVTGAGIGDLQTLLEEAVTRIRPRSALGFARLPIDRVFTLPGFGTVVTGTLASGEISLEDRLELVPGRIPVRVRGLQSHGESRQRCRAGERTAVNLAQIDRDQVERGQVLATPGTVRETSQVTLHLKLLAGAPPLPMRARVRLHIGTMEVIGRLVPLTLQEIPSGGEDFVRFRGETPFPAVVRDRVVVRSFSPARTIGGGSVLDLGGRQRRGHAEDIEELRRRRQASPADMVLGAVRRRFAANVRALAQELGLDESSVGEAVAGLEREGRLRRLGEIYLDREELERRMQVEEDRMRTLWQQDPLWRGLDRQQWRREVVAELGVREAAQLAAELAAEGRIAVEGERVRPTGDGVPMPEELRRLLDGLRDFIAAGGLQPAAPSDWPGARNLTPQRLQDLTSYLAERGELVRAGDIHFSREALREAEDRVRACLAGGREATTAELREALGTTRKYAVPLLEHFDQERLTRRFGDVRRLIAAGEVGGGGS